MKNKPRHLAGAGMDNSSHLNPTRSHDSFQSAHDIAAEFVYRVILAGLDARLARLRGR